MIVLAAAAAVIKRLQVGAMFSMEVLKPKFNKFSPASMLGALKKVLNPFSAKNAVEVGKSLLKLLIIGGIGFNVVMSRKDELFGLVGADINTAFAVLGSILMQMIINMCLMMLLIGIIDKKFQDYQFEKSIKMTKQEIKDEYKNVEGNPQIKAKIRAMQMQMAQQRMMSEIKDANVVVVNPTHYAVALKYDRLVAPAPKVVAKGVDFLAFKIREIAKNNNVPIVENKPLAQSLYKLVPLGDIIPAELYTAVAEVLAYVYNKNRGGR